MLTFYPQGSTGFVSQVYRVIKLHYQTGVCTMTYPSCLCRLLRDQSAKLNILRHNGIGNNFYQAMLISNLNESFKNF